MSWTVELYDPVIGQTVDITSRTIQVSSSEKLDSESNTFSLSCINIQENHKWNKVEIKKDGIVKYGGIVLNQSDESKFIKFTKLDCVDWSYIFNMRAVAENYVSTDSFSGRPDLIIKNMVQKYAPELTTNNVRQCIKTIDRLPCLYITLLEATKNLIGYLADWHWYVDAAKDVHFFERYESNGPIFTSANIKSESLNCKFIGDKAANRIWIIGAKEASPNFIDQFFTADGQQRYFTLAYEPNYTQIYVNNVLKTSNLEQNDDGNQDFLINKSQRVVFIPDYRTPFTGTIKVHYRPTIQVIDYFENFKNIQQYGLFERVIKNKNITDKLSARQFGKAEIKRKSVEKRNLSFTTTTGVHVGQRCQVNYVSGDWNIVGYFLVTSVSTNISKAEDKTDVIFYSVELEEMI